MSLVPRLLRYAISWVTVAAALVWFSFAVIGSVIGPSPSAVGPSQTWPVAADLADAPSPGSSGGWLSLDRSAGPVDVPPPADAGVVGSSTDQLGAPTAARTSDVTATVDPTSTAQTSTGQTSTAQTSAAGGISAARASSPRPTDPSTSDRGATARVPTATGAPTRTESARRKTVIIEVTTSTSGNSTQVRVARSTSVRQVAENTDGAPGSTSLRSISTRGGTVVLELGYDAPIIRSVTPNPGYRVTTTKGSSSLVMDLVGESVRSTLTVRWQSGQTLIRVNEG